MGDIVGPAVPRVRGHARRHDPRLGGRLADADADDVRHAAAPHARRRGRAGSTAWSERVFERIDRALRRGRSRWVLAPPARRRCSSRSPRWCSPSCSTSSCRRASSRVQDTGVILGISEAPQSISFAAMAERQQALAARHPEGSGRREPVVVHRRRRHQRHAQQRPHPDQPEAAAPSGRLSAERRHPPPAAGARRGRRASRSSCSRCRTSPSRTASAARSTSTRSRTPTAPSSPTGRRGWSTRLRALPELRDVSSDQQDQGLAAALAIDRDTASRLGITPQIDRRHALRRLRPAAGLDDLHAAEPVPRRPRGAARASSRTADGARKHLRARRRAAAPGAAQRVRPSVDRDDGPARDQRTRASSRR